MAFLFAQPVDIDIKLENEEARKLVDTKIDKERTQSCPVYYDGESVVGQVTVRVRDGRKLVHDGIKVEFVGCIELFYDRGNHHEFLSLSQELAAPGEMRQAQTFDFSFKMSKSMISIEPRYFVRVTLSRRMADVTKERECLGPFVRMPPDSNNSIKMEVFAIKIKHMELSIIRRETTGAAPNQYNESETITKFEIMDGAPVRGETIPIRLFLGGFELTPTFRDALLQTAKITVFRIPEVSMVLIPKSRPALIPSINLELTHGLRYWFDDRVISRPTAQQYRSWDKIYIASGFRNPLAIKPRIRLEQTPQPSHFFSSARSTRIQSQAHYRTLTTMSTIPVITQVLLHYSPLHATQGTFETINGISTYVIGDKSSKKAIVVVMDGVTYLLARILRTYAGYLGGESQTRAVDLVKLGEKLKSEGFTATAGSKLIMIAGASDAFAAVAGFVRFRLLAPEDAANCKAAIGLYPTKDEDPTAMEPFVKIAKDYKLYSSVHHGFAAARARLDDPHHKAEYEDVFRRLSAFFKKHLASAKL
ncbi:Vacuolar protein sorting-associated protein 26 [Rhizoctonia solani]|uniref:Vacuolar protein sorting-associated protein 26 n=1 Tax=Rhizoctonia solani TaxID=456999 RepID=A0A8H7IG52_9AGAM|nr:Vacuolar protein sorting-associated protein 26 [Rhizoctonia solani]